MVMVEKVQAKLWQLVFPYSELIKLTDRKGEDPERAKQRSKLCGKAVRKEAQA